MKPGSVPMTRRVLDTTLLGLTPYVAPRLTRKMLTAKPIRMPRLEAPFWRTSTDKAYSREEIDEILRSDPDIAELERVGVWQGWSRRIFSRVDYFQVAEHSAQIGAGRLRELEGRFRKGRVNVLSCSTTMEMGVDIGGLSAVAMNNAPPSPCQLPPTSRPGRTPTGVPSHRLDPLQHFAARRMGLPEPVVAVSNQVACDPGESPERAHCTAACQRPYTHPLLC